jgi:hypothetical protein
MRHVRCFNLLSAVKRLIRLKRFMHTENYKMTNTEEIQNFQTVDSTDETIATSLQTNHLKVITLNLNARNPFKNVNI